MTAHDAEVSGAGAPSRDAQMWDHANWSHIEAQVRRLQERIAKATREGRWGGLRRRYQNMKQNACSGVLGWTRSKTCIIVHLTN